MKRASNGQLSEEWRSSMVSVMALTVFGNESF